MGTHEFTHLNAAVLREMVRLVCSQDTGGAVGLDLETSIGEECPAEGMVEGLEFAFRGMRQMIPEAHAFLAVVCVAFRVGAAYGRRVPEVGGEVRRCGRCAHWEAANLRCPHDPSERDGELHADSLACVEMFLSRGDAR